MREMIKIYSVPLIFSFSSPPSTFYADIIDMIVDRSSSSVSRPQAASDGNVGRIIAKADEVNHACSAGRR
jgi:hypothetical protein